MGINAAIMELRNQTSSSASDIKKIMQEMHDFANRTWINAMFLSALNRGVADGTLIKVKDTYTLTKQTIETPSKETIEPPSKESVSF